MTAAWRFKAVARMDLGADERSVYMTSQKQGSEATNGTAVTANGEFRHAILLFSFHRVYAVLAATIGRCQAVLSPLRIAIQVVIVWSSRLQSSGDHVAIVACTLPE